MRAPGLVGDASAFPDAVQRVSLHPFLRAATPLRSPSSLMTRACGSYARPRGWEFLGFARLQTHATRKKTRYSKPLTLATRPYPLRTQRAGLCAPPVTHEAGYAGVMAHSHPLHTSRTAASHNAARSPSHIDVKSTSCTWPSGRPRACPRQRRAPCRPRRTPSSGSS